MSDKDNNTEAKVDKQVASTESNSQEFYTGFSPLDEPVKKRAYTSANVDSSQIQGEIEEPTFKAPNFSDFEKEDKEPSSFNPEIAELDKKEQGYATEQMVDTVLDVYVKAHLLANNFTKLKEEKVQSAIDSGEISSSLRVPIDESGNSMGLMEYVGEYNAQLSDAITVEDDFIAKVKPPMIRVFQKKGLALTDEQFLMVTFGGDIITKGALIYQLVKQNNKLLEMWKDQSGVYQAPPRPSNSTPPPTPTPTEHTEEQASQQPQAKEEPIFHEPEEEFTAKSMVSDMMGGKENASFQDAVVDESMPKFGDTEILTELSKLSEEDKVIDITPVKPIKKRGRPKKKK